MGFDLVSRTTSVSMTISGPAPTILALFLNSAIDQQLGVFRACARSSWPAAPRPKDLAQLTRLADYQGRDAAAAKHALAWLQQVVIDGGNVFVELMNAARVCSVGQLPTHSSRPAVSTAAMPEAAGGE